MNQAEWMAEIGQAAEDLGYGIRSISVMSIELIARQDSGLIITIESPRLSGALLRQRLLAIPHRSGSPYTSEYEDIRRHP